ncbi:MAG: hypothetical protein ACRCZY_07585 [Phocaeicola sp.]
MNVNPFHDSAPLPALAGKGAESLKEWTQVNSFHLLGNSSSLFPLIPSDSIHSFKEFLSLSAGCALESVGGSSFAKAKESL